MNTTPKHTPGPWSLEQQSTGDITVMGADSVRLALVTVADYPKQLPNAILIAAAPELLEMLYTVLPAVEESDEFNKPSMKLAPKVRALISKAEGK